MTNDGRLRRWSLKWVLIGLAALLAVGGLLLDSTAPEAEQIAALGEDVALREVAVLRVRSEPVRSRKQVAGVLEPRRTVLLFGETRGPVVAVGAEEFDRVEAGRVLVEIDPLLAEVAVERASAKRFRPILLTTVTTIAGLLPMALGLSGKSVVFGPFAAAIVFGLAMASLLTLFAWRASSRCSWFRRCTWAWKTRWRRCRAAGARRAGRLAGEDRPPRARLEPRPADVQKGQTIGIRKTAMTPQRTSRGRPTRMKSLNL